MGLGITCAVLSNRYARLKVDGIPVSAAINGDDATTSTATGIGRQFSGSTTKTYRLEVS